MTCLMNDFAGAPAPKSSREPTAIDALAAPVADGAMLIEPGVDRLIDMARRNRAQRQSYQFDLLGRPVSEWATPMVDADAPLVIMTGHQPEFFHAGVWIKHVLASCIAQRIGGVTTFLVVDSDVPGTIQISWPIIEGEYARIASSRAGAVMNWRGYEHITDRAEIDYAAMFESVRQSAFGGGDTLLRCFADAMTRDVVDSDTTNYVDRFLAGLRATDAALDVTSPTFVRISDCFDFQRDRGDTVAAALVGHIIEHAAEVAGHYNAALATYRHLRGIRGTHHPIPDLAIDGLRIELPFWVVHSEHPRDRLFVEPNQDSTQIALFAGATRVGDLDARTLRIEPRGAIATALGDFALRPRALAQTLYARLFACDLFIHGIGGAKYDQITDEIIRCVFGIEPPGYGAASATLLLPLPTFDVTESELTKAAHAERDARYNPQRYLTVDERDRMGTLLAEREDAIAESTRMHLARSNDRAARRQAFDRIHAANRKIRDAVPRLKSDAVKDIERVGRQLGHNKIAHNRDWFFALHEMKRLVELRDAVHARVDAAT